MSQMLRALPWALATMMIALANVAGLIGNAAAMPLIAVLPLMTVIAISGKGCASRPKGI